MKSLLSRLAAIRRSLNDELTALVRSLVWGLLATGALFFLAGLSLDLVGATRDYPFIVSMLSSATAACFGIPVALVAVRHLQRSQDTLARRQEAAGMTASAADWIITSLEGFLVDEDRYEHGCVALESILERISASRDVPWQSWEPVWCDAEALRQASKELKTAIHNVHVGVLKREERSDRRRSLNKRWSYLCDHLKPKLYEIAPPLSSPGETTSLERFIEILSSPDGQFPDPFFSRLSLSDLFGDVLIHDELEELADSIDKGDPNFARHFDAEGSIQEVAAACYRQCSEYKGLIAYFESVRDLFSEYLLQSEEKTD
ncbi:hypothetical protein QFZ35_003235 [Arthrobacter ulcerisalmonis]|nr:hypothetical protein [Arthrobacter ulcerisalmonis]MDQ0664737.1 hypothetical protein [Arthrobacter ulcerisalmonis]